jgi:site-specific DNA-methyltransferase (adenine-specific)
MLNKVFNEDCLETMSRMKDNSVDLILTDPPYGINASSNSLGLRKEHTHKRKWDKKNWDKETPVKEIFDEIFRVSKHQIIWGGNYFDIPPCKNYIIWDKKITGNVPFAHCEMAWTSYSNAPTLYSLAVQSISEDKVHPTQKPLKLFDYCIREAIKNDSEIKTIYDPFAGSGTALIVAKSLGLDYIGSELDKDYYNIIQKRLSAVQGSLF